MMGWEVQMRLDYIWRRCFRRLENSFSHGGKWKALMSKYIGIIPLSGDVCSRAEQTISGCLSPRTPVSSATIAKVGVAAKDSQRSTEHRPVNQAPYLS
jgi:hypothetical protein